MNKVKVNLTHSSIVFIAILAVAVHAYWPTYLSVFFKSNIYAHFHAFVALLWVGILITQPYLIKTKRFSLHKKVGRSSVLLAPILVISVFLFAHYKLTQAQGNYSQWQVFVFYLQFSASIFFALLYSLGLYFRRNRAIHSRYMVGTGLTMLDPIFARSLMWLGFEGNPHLAVASVILLILLAGTVLDYKDRNVRWVCPSIILMVCTMQTPIFFELIHMPWWQNITYWFGSL